MSRKQTQIVWDKDLCIYPFLSECFYSGKESRTTGRRHLVWFVWLCLACGPCAVGCSQTAHLKDSRSYWSQHPQKPGAHLKKSISQRLKFSTVRQMKKSWNTAIAEFSVQSDMWEHAKKPWSTFIFGFLAQSF